MVTWHTRFPRILVSVNVKCLAQVRIFIFFLSKFKGILVYRGGTCCYLSSHEVKIEIKIFPPFHSVRIISCVYFFPESMDLFCVYSWPRGNWGRSMNFMFNLQNGKSTFILTFSGVDSVAEKVAALTLMSFLLLSDSFIFSWNSVRSWLCKGTQEPVPVEILCIKTRDYGFRFVWNKELCRKFRILE